MASFVPDISTIYTLQSISDDFYIGYNTTNVAYPYPIYANSFGSFWQFADYGELTGTASTNTYLVRANNDASYCMDMASASIPVYDFCSTDTVLWQVVSSGASENSYFIVPVDTSLYLGTTSDLEPAAAALYTTEMANVKWSFSPVGSLSGTVWSTLPFGAPTSSSVPAGTSSAQAIPSSASTYSRFSSLVTSSTASSVIASQTTSFISATSSGYTSSASLVATAIRKPDFDFAVPLGESIQDWNSVAASVLPPDMDIICTNCSMFGYIDFTANGDDNIMDFARHGSLELQVAGIVANMSLEIELMTGFELVDATIPIYTAPLGTFHIGDHLNVELVAEIGIPIHIILDTPVTLAGGFVYTLPGAATVFVDVNDPINSTATGFEAGTITALPFSYDAPGLTVSMLTGISLTIRIDVTAEDDVVSVVGGMDLELALPGINMTAHALSNIDSSCQPASSSNSSEMSYRYGAEVTTSAGVDLSASGSVVVALQNETAFTWVAPTLPNFGVDIDGPSACIFGDRVDGQTTNSVTNTTKSSSKPASTGMPSLEKPFTMMICALSFLAAVMIMQ